jgi:hypothetical protein
MQIVPAWLPIEIACDWRPRGYNLHATGNHSGQIICDSRMQILHVLAASCVQSRQFFASTLRYHNAWPDPISLDSSFNIATGIIKQLPMSYSVHSAVAHIEELHSNFKNSLHHCLLVPNLLIAPLPTTVCSK